MADQRPASGFQINQTCEICCQRTPTVFCACTGAKIFLCDSCFGLHGQKNPTKFHQMVPANEDPNLIAYQHRCAVFEAGKKELLGNLDRIEQCCTEVTLAVDKVVGKLYIYRDSLVGQLQAWKSALSAELYQAVAEVEAALPQESVLLQGQYASALRDFEEGNLKLFRYWVDTSMVERAIQGILRTEHSEPKQRRVEAAQPAQSVPVLPPSVDLPPMQPEIRHSTLSPLVNVTRYSISLFNLDSLSWQPAIKLSSPIEFDCHYSYTLFDEQRIFYCGNYCTC